MPDSNVVKFKKIAQILCRCEQLKSDILSYSGENARIYREVFPATEILGRTSVYFFQLYILQLCMVLARKEHHHLRTLANELLQDGGIGWQSNTSKAEVSKAIQCLETLEDEVLPTLKVLRDKFIAHRDVDRHQEQATLTYPVAWRVLQELQEIYNLVDFHAFGATVHFSMVSDRDPAELRHLARYSRIWSKLRPEWTRPHDGLVRDLIYIVRGKTPPQPSEL